MSSSSTSIENPGLALAQMRAGAPLVQNITNYVAMNIMANVMLAAGASPAMVHAAEEAPSFVEMAQALTINIGTLSAPWVESMAATAKAAHDSNTPWVFDPVAVGATAYRRDTATNLLAFKPSIIRGNASEIMALAGKDSMGKGVDSADGLENAMASADQLAHKTGAVIAVSGARDYVTDGQNRALIDNGHSLMPKVTALGCSLNGVIAAFAATHHAHWQATIAAMAYYGVAGEIAGQQAAGPGSFTVAFLDALATLDPDQLDQRAKIALR